MKSRINATGFVRKRLSTNRIKFFVSIPLKQHLSTDEEREREKKRRTKEAAPVNEIRGETSGGGRGSKATRVSGVCNRFPRGIPPSSVGAGEPEG